MVKHTLSSSESSIPKKRAVIWKAVSSERQAHEDKVSLVEQERLAREWCDDNDYQVVRILEVPGYSRRESDIISALEEFARKGIYAYHDLRLMWMNHEFDILVGYSHDRFGRSNTLHSWVVENTIMNGKEIYLLADGGYVDADDFRYKLAIGGMMAATPVDRLIKASAAAKDKLISKGLPTGATIPLSHRLVRDPETGKAVRLELNDDLRQLFDDLAELFLEGVAYNYLSRELFNRFGHGIRKGKPYRANHFFDLLWTPTFWGHMARRYTSSSENGNMRGAWVFDETVEPPINVLIARNVVPSVYTGDLADEIKAEMYRRMDMTGKRNPHDTYRFAGLFVCGACGTPMSTRSKPVYGRVGLRCSAVYNRTAKIHCDQRLMMPHRKLQAAMENLLEQLVIGASPAIFSTIDTPTEDPKRIKELKERQVKLEAQILALIQEQASAPETARALYRQQIEQYSMQLERVNEDLLNLQRKLEETEYRSREEIRTVEELKSLTLECFWNLPDREINQWLRRLMGKRKFVVLDREIVDVVDMQR